jgi:hypothetical protein
LEGLCFVTWNKESSNPVTFSHVTVLHKLLTSFNLPTFRLCWWHRSYAFPRIVELFLAPVLQDPFFQRSGASRVAMVATTDKRRQKIVELGGVTSLAKLARNDELDDTTLNQVLDALEKVCKSQEAITALREAELGPRLQQILASRSDSEILSNASVLLEHASPEMVSDG